MGPVPPRWPQDTHRAKTRRAEAHAQRQAENPGPLGPACGARAREPLPAHRARCRRHAGKRGNRFPHHPQVHGAPAAEDGRDGPDDGAGMRPARFLVPRVPAQVRVRHRGTHLHGERQFLRPLSRGKEDDRGGVQRAGDGRGPAPVNHPPIPRRQLLRRGHSSCWSAAQQCSRRCVTAAMPQTTLSGARIGLGVGLLGYAVLLFILIGAVPGGSDNSGYFNEARLLAAGRIHVPVRAVAGIPAGEVPYLYSPLGFKPAADGTERLVPTYPPGLPLLLVPASLVAGWDHAGDLVLLVHSLAGIALVFALGRTCGLPGAWSLAGAAILAASPLYLFTSLQALSDVNR